jgi:uncharacterized membrane protein
MISLSTDYLISFSIFFIPSVICAVILLVLLYKKKDWSRRARVISLSFYFLYMAFWCVIVAGILDETWVDSATTCEIVELGSD